MTTAYYRQLAADLEARCEWARAAAAWQSALDAQPLNPHSQLQQRDRANMSERRNMCEQIAQ